MVDDHLDIRGHHRDEQGDEAPCCRRAGGGEKEAQAAEDLKEAAEVDELEMGREVGRHDPNVDLRDQEVEGSGGYKEDREEDAGWHGLAWSESSPKNSSRRSGSRLLL